MGWSPFKKVSKTLSGIVKNPTNFKNYADLAIQTVTGGQVDTEGVNGFGSFEDVLYGKKTKTDADDVAKMVKAGQARGISDFNRTLDGANPEAMVKLEAETAKKGILASAQDARRNAQRVMAQRGLQNSSLGLAQNRTIDQNAGREIASVNAGIPGAITDKALMLNKERISQGGLGASNPIQWNTETNRRGGMLDLAGKIAPIAGMVAGLPSIGSALGSGAAAASAASSAPVTSGSTGLRLPTQSNYSMGTYKF